MSHERCRDAHAELEERIESLHGALDEYQREYEAALTAAREEVARLRGALEAIRHEAKDAVTWGRANAALASTPRGGADKNWAYEHEMDKYRYALSLATPVEEEYDRYATVHTESGVTRTVKATRVPVEGAKGAEAPPCSCGRETMKIASGRYGHLGPCASGPGKGE